MNVVLYEGPFVDEEGERDKGGNSIGFLYLKSNILLK